MDGNSGAYSGTMTSTAIGFPAATFTSTSRSGQVGPQSGASTWLPAGSPPGAVYGSSEGRQYLNLRPAADNATSPSVTTYTFATPTPAAGWTFVLGDIDADQVTITATAPDGSAVPVQDLGFAGVFNYCDASPRSSACSGVSAPFDLPGWDPATATLTGNAAATDTTGAAGWFQPTVPIKTLTFTYRWRSGFPVYQTWFATQTRTVSGTVTGDGAGLAGVSVEIVDSAGTVVTTTTTAADGSYAANNLAPGSYTVRVVTPGGYVPVGPTERPANLVGGDVSGVDFTFTVPADLTITKTVDTTPVVAGDPVRYTLTAHNAGPADATGVSITDTLPSALTGVTGQITGGADCTLAGSVLTCPVGSLANGASATVTVIGQLPATAPPGDPLRNSAAVAGQQADPTPGNNRDTVASTITAAADLTMVKTFTPDTPVSGGTVDYQLTVTNDGPSRATGLVISDPLDPNVTFDGAEITSGECGQDDGLVTCTVPTLEAGASVTATVHITLAAGTTAALQNTASVTAGTPDPDPDNNTGTATFQPNLAANLSLGKSVSPATAASGTQVSYQLTVTNAGPSDAPNVVLTDSLPAGLTAITVTDADEGTCTVTDQVTCRWDSVPGTQTRTVSLTGTVAADAPDGALTNTASVTAPIDDTDPTDNAASATVTIASSADVTLSKTAAPDPAVTGQPVTFILVVGNDGPQRAGQVQLDDPIPAGLTVTAVDDPDCAIDDGFVSCLFPGLDPDESRTVTVTADLAADYSGDELTNTATATSLLTADPKTDNNTATATVAITAGSNLTVTKTAAATTVDQGDPVEFTVTVANNGPADQADVVVTESPAPGLTITSATPTAGTWDGAAKTWTVPTLAAGASARLTVSATANGVGAQTNTAMLTGSARPDTDPTDNKASATVTVDPVADLALAKTVSPTSAAAGDLVTYQVTATNNGPSTAGAVHVIDTLPAGVTGPTESGAEACTISGQTVDCDLGDFPSGGSATITIGVVVAADATGSVVNTATISSSTADPDPSNNTATAEFTAPSATPTTPTTPNTPPPWTPAQSPTPPAAANDYTTPLASTGAPILQQAVMAAVLLTAGAVLIALARRPRTRRGRHADD
jgi:uncharacterized repeat protein (TIGR01451 family)